MGKHQENFRLNQLFTSLNTPSISAFDIPRDIIIELNGLQYILQHLYQARLWPFCFFFLFITFL